MAPAKGFPRSPRPISKPLFFEGLFYFFMIFGRVLVADAPKIFARRRSLEAAGAWCRGAA